ncbi:molybdopterin dehydrogenase [Cohnella sp. CFH 77786]|uniref:FAD binding domain-containing protein n=1 Tax=Cohnella sp. CFH 77786 TaxID=2662265 RepID=UPI001C608ED3|nr:FAD binding domain-containing protein [Cohnella sp. CFH 77786]MBW5448534.1 molybdopterin dehydrogenase [Cohnella sp. CFH 77786]
MAMERHERFSLPKVWKPRNVGEAWSLKRSFGSDAEYVAGGTLLRTWWEGEVAERPAHLIDIRSLPLLAGIRIAEEGGTGIGACTTLAEIRRSCGLAAEYPALPEAVLQIGAYSIRNVGTIGGNVASGIGDALPALLVYDAELLWFDGSEERIAISEWLERPEDCRRDRGKLLMQVRLPDRANAVETPTGGGNAPFSVYRKVGRREAFTPSVATVAISAGRTEDGRLERVRIAAGGGAAVPHRLYAAESLLEGKTPDPDLLPLIHEAVEETFRPKGDVFAGEEYRKRTAANLVAAELWKLSAGRQGKE